MRAAIADYRVLEPWARPGRFVCRPPDRLGRTGPVMLRELEVDAEGWPQLCDHLLRLASVPEDKLLEVIEVGPDLATGRVFLVTAPAEPAWPDAPGGAVGDPGRVVQAVAAAARCAHDLHEMGLTHGAIRPDAILRGPAATVLDLPRLDGPAGEVISTGTWKELLTISPELLSGEPPSRSSDVWALGATLHALVSQDPLFPGIERDEPVTAVQRIMFTRPEIDPTIPPGLAEVIAACLATDAADRPRSAADVADRLAGAGLRPGPGGGKDA
ncbi:MAG: hypothetical protein M0Z30_10190 [Actinomycetota bacterium]|nr:hypothetical protein [Actinomycetota bacterium]